MLLNNCGTGILPVKDWLFGRCLSKYNKVNGCISKRYELRNEN
jgi:hypothetical protein